LRTIASGITQKKIIMLKFFIAITLASSFALVGAQSAVAAGVPNALLYVTNSPSSIKSLRAHVNSMDIIAPQTYAATEDGRLLGSPSAEMLKLARDAGARVMPLVVNQKFSQALMHGLLLDEQAQKALIANLITEAKKHGYIGYQYDFEHMQASDRDLYSKFVAKSAPYFHGAGLQLSVAMAPLHTDDQTKYGVGSWQNWTGAFDYAAIGAAADFVSVMAYDDSRSAGPVASVPWVEEVIAYTLARIPAEKVSLGIPFYAWIWSAKTGERVDIRGYPAIADVLTSKQVVKKSWSPELGVPSVTYKKGGKTYVAWYEDQKSFLVKMDLVSEHQLFGFSAWALGLEDPNVWDSMVAMRAPRYGLAMR
jgi:spore germination protein YaaH